MDMLARKELRGKWRERLFRTWVIASAVVAVYACLIGPITAYLGEGQALVALSVPILMFFLLATVLGWLVLLFFSHPEEHRQTHR